MSLSTEPRQAYPQEGDAAHNQRGCFRVTSPQPACGASDATWEVVFFRFSRWFQRTGRAALMLGPPIPARWVSHGQRPVATHFLPREERLQGPAEEKAGPELERLRNSLSHPGRWQLGRQRWSWELEKSGNLCVWGLREPGRDRGSSSSCEGPMMVSVRVGGTHAGPALGHVSPAVVGTTLRGQIPERKQLFSRKLRMRCPGPSTCS